MVPFLAPEKALAIAIMSYNGRVDIGLMGDYDAMPDLADFAGYLEDELGALAEAAGVAPKGAARKNGRVPEPANWRGHLAYFKDADEVYRYIGKLFEDLTEDEELAPKFRKANTIVQYRYREPESVITVKLLDGEDGQVDCGNTDLEPEVVVDGGRHRAQVLARQGQRDRGPARGQMKAKGPVAKILKLVPLTKPIFPRYRAMLEQSDRKDLLEAG